MKKHFYTLGLMLASTFTLTNCAQEIDNPNDVPSAGIPFEIVATSAETKTANTDATVNWVAGDALNIFHAEAGSNEYINDESFTVTAEDLASGRFTGKLKEALTAGSYDWYAFYPYTSYIQTPANTSTGYTPVGSKAGAQQTQKGYDNMNHIAGENYPLYGVAIGVASNVKPSFEMKHAYTIAKIVVKNTADKELTVNTVSFTAPEAIVGTYYINFAGETLVYTGSGENYVSNVANLTVSDGTALAKNAEATFYLAFKPFTAAAGSELKIAVNGYEKTLPLENSVTFSAGKIKTLNFEYAKVEEPAPVGVNEVTISFATTDQRTSLTTNEQIWENNGVTFTNAKGSSTSNVADYSDPARFYKNSNITVTAPGNISKIEFTCNTASYATALKNSIGDAATISDKVVTVSANNETTFTCKLSGGQVRMDAVIVTYTDLDPTAPSISANDVSDVSARGVTDAELKYSIVNLEFANLQVTCDGTIVTSAKIGEDGKITYSVAMNKTTLLRSGSITISSSVIEKTVTVAQKAPVFKVSKTTVDLDSNKGDQKTITVTSDFDWTLTGGGEGYTVTPESFTWAEEEKQTVTITASDDRTEEGVAELGTITITNSVTNDILSITVSQNTSYVHEDGDVEEAVTETITFDTDKTQRKSYSTTEQVWTSGLVTFTNAKASSSTDVGDYSNPVRLYQGSTVTIAATGGDITEIVIVSDGTAKYKTALETSLKNAELVYTNSGNNYTVTISEASSSVTFSLSAQARFKSLSVSYIPEN